MLNDEQQHILRETEAGIEDLTSSFSASPEWFFTEHDMTSYLYHSIQSRLNFAMVQDCDDNSHQMVHCEYPTPFKCDMRGGSFRVVSADSSFRRGHYDLVVLNPEFIRQCGYDVIKAQRFSVFQKHLLGPQNTPAPVVLFGMELHLARDPIKTRGRDKSRSGLNRFLKEVHQDHQKLIASMRPAPGFTFMHRAISLVFDVASGDEVRDQMLGSFKETQADICIRLIPARRAV